MMITIMQSIFSVIIIRKKANRTITVYSNGSNTYIKMLILQSERYTIYFDIGGQFGHACI